MNNDDEWHEPPDLPPSRGLYVGFWYEDGAWIVEYKLASSRGQSTDWYTATDKRHRPPPVAWHYLPAVPQKYLARMKGEGRGDDSG